ncbi:MAG TPA: hypothetical protein VI094_03585 [Propionibacteriaceae bacterium]
MAGSSAEHPALQDRSFNADGSLFYPDSRGFFDGIVRGYIPAGKFSPIWNPEFFGNMIMANGNTWPFQTVEQRRYRFRFLNGREHVGENIAHGVPVGRRVRPTSTAQVGRDHSVVLGERRDDLAPLPPVLREAVQEQDRRGIRVPGLGDVHPQAGRERDERVGHTRELRHLRSAARGPTPRACGARQEYRSQHPCTTFAPANSPPATCGAGPWLLDALGLRRVGLVAHDFSAFVGFRLCFDHPERVAAFLCLLPHPYLRFKPQMLAGIPQLWFQPVVATPGLGPWALRTDRLARHLLAGFTTTPDSITDEDLAVFAGRLHAQGHPEAGSALYRNLIPPEMGRFLASTSYRKRRLTVPTVSLMGGADAGVRPGMLDGYGGQADDLAGHIIDGAAHFLADDRPDAVVTHALTLFGRVL